MIIVCLQEEGDTSADDGREREASSDNCQKQRFIYPDSFQFICQF